MNLSESGRVPRLLCPIDRGILKNNFLELICSDCGTSFPIIRDIPILINDKRSAFAVSDYIDGSAYGGSSQYAVRTGGRLSVRSLYRRFAVFLSEAPLGPTQIDPITEIRKCKPDARILVIGAGERKRLGRVVLTDVAFASDIDCICDAHDLPFPDRSFDGVLAEAVLEHVCDPQRVVAEISRVLTDDGLVFAITPFMQPVHMGAYDFNRFTFLGHRRLFRHYSELDSGIAGGSFAAFILGLRALVVGMSGGGAVQSLLRLAALIITYPLRFLDRFFRRRVSYNYASAFYFFGRKREEPISDRELIGMFRG